MRTHDRIVSRYEDTILREANETKTLPSFAELVREFGVENARRKWNDFHRADEAVKIKEWDGREFLLVHEHSKKYGGRGVPNPGPDNAAYLVTPTGARFYDPRVARHPVMGEPDPIDPETEPVLHLSWLLRRAEALAARAHREFVELKQAMIFRMTAGIREADDMNTLDGLRQQVLRHREEVAAIAEQRQPLLPRELQPPSSADIQLRHYLNQMHADFDARVRAMEV